MIRHDDATVRLERLSENDVTSPLPVLLVAGPSQSLNDFTTGDARQLAHTSTSTNSPVIGGGTGSPCASRLSR
jgi:hypothetical protein